MTLVYGSNPATAFMLNLYALISVPLITAAFILCIRDSYSKGKVRLLSLCSSILCFFLSINFWYSFDKLTGKFQFLTTYSG